MSFNYYGIVILFFPLLPQLFLKLIPARRGIKVVNRHLQISIIDKICFLGIIVFGLLNIEGIGYKDDNMIINYIWLIGFISLNLLLYASHLRYYFYHRRINYLYDKIIIPCPIYSLEAFIFLFSSILLRSYIVLFFAIIYMICHTYLGIQYNKLAKYM